MQQSISQFLGFSEQEVREIAQSEGVSLPQNVDVLEELRSEHKVAIAA